MKLRIASLNIAKGMFIGLEEWSGVKVEDPVNYLTSKNLDIVCLQEVSMGDNIDCFGKDGQSNYKTFSAIIKAFEGYFFYFAPTICCHYTLGNYYRGNLTVSKYPIIFSKTNYFLNGKTIYYDYDKSKLGRINGKIDFRKEPRVFICTTIDVNGDCVDIVNIHGVWSPDVNESEAGQDFSCEVVNSVNKKKPTVIVGDFNTSVESNSIKIFKKNFTDVFKNSEEGTQDFRILDKLSSKNFTDKTSRRIDLAFVSDHFKVELKNSNPTKYPVSDHHPLLFTLSF